MRREARVTINPTMARVQGYHEEGYGETYAFRGFTGNWYFNSDRKIRLDDNFQRADGQPLQGYGLEIETECTGVRNASVLAELYDKIIFPVFKFGSDMFKMQRDGSLGGDTAAEVITQVMTKSRIRNDYAAYKAMFNHYFPAFGINSNCYETSCGMHVNISNALFGKTREQQIDNIRKLVWFVDHNYAACCALFYRNPDRTCYCRAFNMTKEQVKRLDIARVGSHGVCMNMTHFNAGRIELRLVGGQKDFGCFRNTMETVFHIVEKLNSLSWDDIDDMVKVFTGCNQYVFDRLNTLARRFFTEGQLNDIAATVKREALI